MKYNEYKLEDAQVKITKDEVGYQEVLEDFKNAQVIRIVTYNLNYSKDLFNYLYKLGKSVDIQLITNIPSSYYIVNSYAKRHGNMDKVENVKDDIKSYFDIIDPNKFNSNISSFFNFSNHAKIIGTENIVYIGSANFSGASFKKYEAGIISYDKKFINELYNGFFEKLKSDSEPYFKKHYSEVKLRILSIYQVIVDLNNYLLEKVCKNEEGMLLDGSLPGENLEGKFFIQLSNVLWDDVSEIISFKDEDNIDESMRIFYSQLINRLQEIDMHNIQDAVKCYMVTLILKLEHDKSWLFDETGLFKDKEDKLCHLQRSANANIIRLRNSLANIIDRLEECIKFINSYHECGKNDLISKYIKP